MARQPSRTPKYRGPKKGWAYVKTVLLNGGKEVYLGRYNSRESRRAYAKIIAQLAAEAEAQDVLPPPAPGGLTIVELIAHYRDDLLQRMTDQHGRVKKEFRNVMRALVQLDEHFGDLLANEFEPSHLETLQIRLAKAGVSRKLLNKRITIVKRFFGWCSRHAATSGVRKTLFHELAVVKGLKPGEYGVRESPKVRPVPLVIVEKTLPFMTPVVAAMVRTQLICGMRPDEVCRLTEGEIDRSGPVWVYRPDQHKGAWRGKDRMIAIPAMLREALEPYFTGDPESYLFSPAISEAERHRMNRPPRKTKIYPSELRRRARLKAERAARGLRYRDRFEPESYWRTIRNAILRARQAGVTVPSWNPYRLRHAARKLVADALGQEAAQHWLGHENLATTDLYTSFELAELTQLAERMEPLWDTVLARTPGIVKPELNCSTKPPAASASRPQTSS